MFKLITILFILYYINQLLFQNRKLKKDLNKVASSTKLIAEEEKMEFISNNVGLVISVLFKTMLLIAATLVEIVYIFFAFSYGSVYVVGSFLALWVVLLVISTIKSKIKKDKPLKEKYSIRTMFINIIDIAFFVYMFIQVV